jgi:hypothetical protein
MSTHVTLLLALGVAVPAALSALGRIARELYTILTVRQLSRGLDSGERATISTQLVETLRSGPKLTNHSARSQTHRETNTA